ncbi:hypothetical protein F4777DRAFT_552452 [Nemania sp. FL0916]|nr:hypothetical protein F4777DRAFT_552452 [Nemania sp. FL0916]
MHVLCEFGSRVPQHVSTGQYPARELKLAEDLVVQAKELAGEISEQFFYPPLPVDCTTTGERLDEPLSKNSMETEQCLDIESGNIINTCLLMDHLICPFYVRQKERYRNCLTRVDLRNIEDLKEHLEMEHLQPSYCPTCYETFASALSWQEHIQQRLCAPSTRSRPEGVSILQIQQLAQQEDPWVSRELQWLSIWEIVFPGVKLPSLAVSSDGVEILVWMLRDCWAVEGNRIMSRFLAERGLDEKELNSTLGSLVLGLAIDQLFEKCTQERADGAN